MPPARALVRCSDRNLRAAMMFINNSEEISAECKRYSHIVACYHMYQICDRSTNFTTTISICKKDCERLETQLCAKELAMAAAHELVGNSPTALLPRCAELNDDAVEEGKGGGAVRGSAKNSQQCIPVLELPTVSTCAYLAGNDTLA